MRQLNEVAPLACQCLGHGAACVHVQKLPNWGAHNHLAQTVAPQAIATLNDHAILLVH